MDRTPPPPLWLLLERSADAVHAVGSGRSLSELLPQVPAAQRPGVQALTFAALRQLGAARQALSDLAPKPPAPAVAALLHVALALLWPGEGPPPYAAHTLVDQAVAAARRRAPAAAGFVNAVLRRFLRERNQRVASALRTPEARWNHPPWWIAQLQHDWPGPWQALLAAANQHPPMTLRVNRRRCSGADYVQRLAAAGQPARLLADAAYGGQAVVLDRPCAVDTLPGFADGAVSVQDASAQRAAYLLAAAPPAGVAGALPAGARVLDACAAPGGKTAQLLELGDFDVLALDDDAQRLARVHATLQRLDLQAQLRCGDASRPDTWWDGRPFDAILLDAPCSASGIVRRHPDIRWLRRAGDLRALAALQARLLDALWPLLAPGGRLVYATCSIFKCEGQQQIDAFLQRRGGIDAALHPASPGQLLTLADNRGDSAAAGEVQHDGFFLALLRKTRSIAAPDAPPAASP
ncbi:MAG TPA: 16S rRNA (cytosine(967)-C(5))-methyltransferase RsmB [Rubrivivax sp.]|nr:16S rRNA (cytosine(967)-C(5))-methyltransferase RsmB [Rubrivivax sp.]HPO19309.1 16S rRNA (cytosine(967)-C(5))-methyltransferase RsmB [Rubrivivax sp.]